VSVQALSLCPTSDVFITNLRLAQQAHQRWFDHAASLASVALAQLTAGPAEEQKSTSSGVAPMWRHTPSMAESNRHPSPMSTDDQAALVLSLVSDSPQAASAIQSPIATAGSSPQLAASTGATLTPHRKRARREVQSVVLSCPVSSKASFGDSTSMEVSVESIDCDIVEEAQRRAMTSNSAQLRTMAESPIAPTHYSVGICASPTTTLRKKVRISWRGALIHSGVAVITSSSAHHAGGLRISSTACLQSLQAKRAAAQEDGDGWY
jgi:hypothetical protein